MKRKSKKRNVENFGKRWGKTKSWRGNEEGMRERFTNSDIEKRRREITQSLVDELSTRDWKEGMKEDEK